MGVQSVGSTLTRRPLVWWAGADAGALIDRLDGTVAVPQSSLADRAVAVADARRRGLGVMLEGEAWRAQVPPDERDADFNALPWVDPTRAHAPDDWSRTEREDFAEAYLEAQDDLATLLVTPGHVGCAGVDVELAKHCSDIARARALLAARPGDPSAVRRSLAATVVVRAEDLHEHGLVDAWASVDVDAYVVWAHAFAGDEEETARLFAFARLLREHTGREVVLGGLGGLWPAALATSTAGAICDLGAPGVYHGALLGSAPEGPERRRLFMRHPCPCGTHAPGTTPEGPALLAHNLWWARFEARQATLAPDRAELLLSLRAVAAAKRRDRLGLTPLPTGWSVLADVDESLVDDADETG